MGPRGVDFDLQGLRDTAESSSWAIPAIDLTFVQIDCTPRGLKEEIKRGEDISGYLGGSNAKKNGVVCKEGMVNRRDSISEG